MTEIFNHLKSYGFVKAHKIKRQLNKTHEAKLDDLLMSYLEVAQNQPLVTQAPLGVTDIYPDSRAIPFSLKTIEQLAIYTGKIYIHDPLLKMVDEWESLDHRMPLLLKYPTHEDRITFFRNELLSVLEMLFALKPLIEAGIVHLTPTELMHPKRKPGLMYSDDLYGPGDQLDTLLGPRLTLQDFPTQLKEYFDKSLMVWPATFENGEPVPLESETLSPRNMIAIGFLDDPIFNFYQYFHILPPQDETKNNDSELHVQLFFDTQGKKPVDKETFKNWVEGSKYKTISEVLDRLERDLILAKHAGAKFLTTLPSSRDLVLVDMTPGSQKASDKVVTALLRFELPYFEKVDANSIVKARQNELAFEEFRSAIQQAFREIELLPQSEEFQERVSEIYHDLLITPLAKVDRQMKVLRRNLFLNAIPLLGSLVATFMTQGNTLLTSTTILAAAHAVDKYIKNKEQEDQVKQLPSFFYWELIGRNK